MDVLNTDGVRLASQSCIVWPPCYVSSIVAVMNEKACLFTDGDNDGKEKEFRFSASLRADLRTSSDQLRYSPHYAICQHATATDNFTEQHVTVTGRDAFPKGNTKRGKVMMLPLWSMKTMEEHENSKLLPIVKHHKDHLPCAA